MDMRWKFQSETLGEHLSLGADDQHRRRDPHRRRRSAQSIDLMDQSWWFPAVAPMPGAAPLVMLAERSLPGSLIVDQNGDRFVNESTDYMSFGQRVARAGTLGQSGEVHVDRLRPEVPQQLCVRRGTLPPHADPADLVRRRDRPPGDHLGRTRPEDRCAGGTVSPDLSPIQPRPSRCEIPTFIAAAAAYDRYYGDPTVAPNPNLRPLDQGPFYAVKMVLSDLGTCGGLRADDRARVLREDGSVIDGLYAIGNTAANAFGTTYPGAGATIAQGLVYGYIAARDAAAPVVEVFGVDLLLDLVPVFRRRPRDPGRPARCPLRRTRPRPRRDP